MILKKQSSYKRMLRYRVERQSGYKGKLRDQIVEFSVVYSENNI